MNCAILSVGTELLFGNTLNTNENYLSQQLNMLGFNVLYHHTVGDNPLRLRESLEYLREKTDLIITTGGLGPTEDDLTKEVICDVYHNKLMLSNEILGSIKAHFENMPENNVKQAYVPEKGHILYNNQGTAPGFVIEDEGKIIISMPGPPREMKAMFNQSVIPYLKGLTDEQFYTKTLRFFGIGESKLEQELMPLIHGQKDPTLATYAQEGQCKLRITSKTNMDVVLDTVNKVKDLVGEFLYSEDDEELVDVVGRKLIEKGLTISSAESITCGMFVSTLGTVPGISKCLKESYVTYSNEAKMKLLGVKEDTLDKFTEVSHETALEMALGLYTATGSDICISVTGYAGPTGDVGKVFIGIKYLDYVDVKELHLPDRGRAWIRNKTVLTMLQMINKVI
ncbi:MAG: competence/damage-inducible protein A [Clostridia bacterium]|nr:competence/damage-inducible protein A [Clostridia bacterium]